MKSFKTLRILVIVFLILVNASLAQLSDPEPPEPQARNLVSPIIRVDTSYNSSQDTVTYFYSVESGLDSLQPINTLAIESSLEETRIVSPEGWTGSFTPESKGGGSFPARIRWGASTGMIEPGQKTSGFEFEISALPKVTRAFCTGWAPIPEFDAVPRFASAPKPIPLDQRFKTVDSIGPGLNLKDSHSLLEILDFILQEQERAAQLNWLPDLTVKMNEIRVQLESGSPGEAKQLLILLIEELETRPDVNENAYNLLVPSLKYLVSRIPNNENLVLQTITISKHVKPHKSERVKIEIVPSSRADLEISVYRVANRSLPGNLGEKVFSQSVPRVASTFVFIWNGEMLDGAFSENGDYDVVIKADDGFGNNDTKVVSVQVNRQGKQAFIRTILWLAKIPFKTSKRLAAASSDPS